MDNLIVICFLLIKYFLVFLLIDRQKHSFISFLLFVLLPHLVLRGKLVWIGSFFFLRRVCDPQ
jgi:hypothetical protein